MTLGIRIHEYNHKINADPLFIAGYYLSQVAAGQLSTAHA